LKTVFLSSSSATGTTTMVEGTLGEAPGKSNWWRRLKTWKKVSRARPRTLMVLTQTTLSVDETRDVMRAVKTKFPQATIPPKDVHCYATAKPAGAVKELARRGAEVFLWWWGSKNQLQIPNGSVDVVKSAALTAT